MIDAQDEGEVSDLEDEYTLLGELGRGGSAVVYRARDRALFRDVAIKVVRPKFAANADDAIARLTREARTVARLQHPNIVTVHAVKRLRDGGLALVMQLVPGRTLKQAVMDDGPFDAERAERVLKDVAEALAFAHARGVVHRDVKPENIFMEVGTGRALLSDFGIAHSSEFDSRLTMTGAAIGTPAYMSPEQIDGAPANARSDVYSLGLVAWEMLTGTRPWEGEALYNVIFKQKNEQLPAIDALRPNAVPPRLQYIVERMLQKKPAARWAGAEGLLTALNNWVVPGDWRQWEESHRRRREVEKATPRAKAVAKAAKEAASDATVRFPRPAASSRPTPASGRPGVSIPRRPTPTASAAAITPSVAPSMTPSLTPSSARAVTPSSTPLAMPAQTPSSVMAVDAQEDATPSWASEAAPRSRRPLWSVLALASLVIAGGALGMYAQRAGMLGTWLDRQVAPATTLADGRAVQVPVMPPSRMDSLGSMADSIRREALADSVRRDSLQADVATRTQRAIDSVRADSMAAAAMRRAERRAARLAAGTTAGVPATSAAPAPTRADAVRADAVRGDAVRADAVRATDDAGVIAAGGRHSCALVNTKVFCWGANEKGQLGDGDVESRETPAPISGDLDFAQVTTGSAHSCGLSRTGEAYCWGANDRGQLGDATTTSRSAPVRVAGNQTFRSLHAGQYHTCGLTSGGEIACWGSNENGQLGIGSLQARSAPATVSLTARFISVSAGWSHTCAIAGDGTAYCWGQNANGQLGNGSRNDSRIPVVATGGVKFTSMAAGSTHTCAVDDAGSVWCWGRNTFGQLGSSGTSDQVSPVRVETATRFVSVTVGGVHSCARTRTGQAWCWGRNVYGQLGDGTTTNRSAPTRVIGGAAFTAINATGAHSCAQAADGEVLCWGFNIEGQVGDGSRNHRARPTKVTLASP